MEKNKETLKYNKVNKILVEEIFKDIKEYLHDKFDDLHVEMLYFLWFEGYDDFLKKFIEVALNKIYEKVDSFSKLKEAIIENLKIFVNRYITPATYQARVWLSLDLLKIINEK